jgi:hypothetical protein
MKENCSMLSALITKWALAEVESTTLYFRRGTLEHDQGTLWMIITPEVLSEINLQMDFDRISSDVALPLGTFDHKPPRGRAHRGNDPSARLFSRSPIQQCR